MAEVMSPLGQLLTGVEVDARAVEVYLDGLTNAERIAETMALGRHEQRRLHDAVKGHRRLRTTDIVDPSAEPLAEVVFEGRNTLPAFTRFAKVFCRSPVHCDTGASFEPMNRHFR